MLHSLRGVCLVSLPSRFYFKNGMHGPLRQSLTIVSESGFASDYLPVPTPVLVDADHRIRVVVAGDGSMARSMSLFLPKALATAMSRDTLAGVSTHAHSGTELTLEWEEVPGLHLVVTTATKLLDKAHEHDDEGAGGGDHEDAHA